MSVRSRQVAKGPMLYTYLYLCFFVFEYVLGVDVQISNVL